MLKKLLFLALPVAALAIALMPTASADYYDCQGNLRPGTPGPSQCHYLTAPPAAVPQVQPVIEPVVVTPRPYVFEPLQVELSPLTVEILQDDSDDDDNEGHVENTRKYCVRDYCYFIFEICYDNGYCEEKAERVDRDEYENYERPERERCTSWGECLNNYTYNYVYNTYNNYYNYNNHDDDCRYTSRGCVYRGAHYGRYSNRYWDF